MPFYHFHQNNTGGYFIFDEKQGISCNVIIEGDNLDEIIKRAKAIGIYFDGCKKGYDCRCCGDRWTRPWPDEPLDKVPTQYGKRVYPNQSYRQVGLIGIKWMKKGKPEGYIHYKDGRIVPYDL